jgi:hypothetical protein
MIDWYSTYRIISVFLLLSSLALLAFSARRHYPGYSVRTHWISNLGESTQRSHRWFKIAIYFLLISGPFLVWQTASLFSEQVFLMYAATVCLTLLGVSLLIVTFIPVDVDPPNHIRVASVLFSAIAGFDVIVLVGVLKIDPQNILLAVISMWALVLCVLMIAALFRLVRKYPEGVGNLTKLKHDEQSKMIKSVTILEWLVLVLNLFLLGVIAAAS